MRFTVTIECEGAAMRENVDEAVAGLLEDLAGRVRVHGTERDENDPYALVDYNGNTVGRAQFEEVD